MVYTVCPLPQTFPFLCENIAKNNITCNTRITYPINHHCDCCQEHTRLNQHGLEPPKHIAKNVTVDISYDSQIGWLLAMINGDVNKRIPSWAL